MAHNTLWGSEKANLIGKTFSEVYTLNIDEEYYKKDFF